MKKTFVSVMAAVLALIMVLSFAACGTNREKPVPPAAKESTTAGSESGTGRRTDPTRGDPV